MQPKSTPPELIDILNKAINAGLADPSIKARLASLGVTAFPGSPTDFGKHIADETDKWAKVDQVCGHQAELIPTGLRCVALEFAAARRRGLRAMWRATCLNISGEQLTIREYAALQPRVQAEMGILVRPVEPV